MDDLDHSIHIAENDWTSFYEDCEECGLQQPLLACPDHTSLSDSEDSRNSSPLLITGPEANSDKSEGIAGSWCVEEVQSDLSISRRDQGEEDRETPLSCEIGLDCPEGSSANTEEVHGTAAEKTNCDVTEKIQAQSSSREAAELRGDNGNQTESDICELKPVQEADPLSLNQTEPDVNEPQSADRAESEDVSGRAERERWFVTVNTNPARQRVRVPSGKKKRRQKKSRREGKMCRTNKQKCFEIGSTLEIDMGNNEPDISDRCLTAGENRAISDLSPMSSTSEEEGNSSDKPFISMSLPLRDIFPLRGTFTPKGPKRFDSLESEEYLSTHSYESESYLSAAESMDEPLSPPLQSPVSLTKNSPLINLMENTISDDTQVTAVSQLSLNDSTHSDPTAANSEGHGSPDAGPMQTLPSVQQRVNKMPDDHSACVNDTRSMVPCMSSDTAGLQKHEINLPASACSSGDQLSPLTVPDLTVTPCAAVDSPEAYAAAAGNTRPVFAISAFWDEMEKLTINDILQLRMGKSPTPRETQKPATPDIADFKTIPCSLVESVGHNLSTGGLMDTSDTADSDYFTQVDESKPHRSSCEFSTSDFEEEYWQFLGASRNQSPDTLSEYQQETLESSLLEEEDSTCSEGKETPVPSVDFFEDQDYSAFTSIDPECPRQIKKSKSVQDVPALNMEDLSLQLFLSNNDSSLVHSSCLPQEEDIVLEASDILGTSVSAPFLSDTNVLDDLSEIPFLEVFQHLLTDQTKRESCVTIFHPEISLAPEFNLTSGDQKSFLSLHDSQWSNQNPIPIFSCSHPTVRELTFPDPDFVFLSSKSNEDNDIPPLRVVSHSLILGKNVGTFVSGFPSLLSIKKIPFQNKGSIWGGSTSPWVFPVEAVNKHIKEEGSPLTVLEEGSVPISLTHLFGEPAMQHGVLGTIQTSRREGIFSALKQSDMCLVCIAFASWVLRSSDPEAADTWKAALLANVSALSAIQYLRQYVKKNPSQDDP